MCEQCGRCSLSAEREPAKINHQPPPSLPPSASPVSQPLLSLIIHLNFIPPSSPLSVFFFLDLLPAFLSFFFTIHMSRSTFSNVHLSSSTLLLELFTIPSCSLSPWFKYHTLLLYFYSNPLYLFLFPYSLSVCSISPQPAASTTYIRFSNLFTNFKEVGMDKKASVVALYT